MKYYILFLLVMCAQIRTAERPPAPPTGAGKRPKSEVVEPTKPAKAAKVQAKEKELSVLEALPDEIKMPILKALSVEKGFGNEKLYQAAANIRALRVAGSTLLQQAIDNPEILGDMVTKLTKDMSSQEINEQQYYKNILDTIIAFHTKPAIDWFRMRFAGDINMYAALSRAIINFAFDNKFDEARFLLELAYSSQSDTYKMLHLNTVNNAKQNLLMAIAKLADTKIMLRILNTIVSWSKQYEAPDINWIDDNSRTALEYAILSGNNENVELLIELGALAIWRNEQEEIVGSALLPAAYKNNLALVERFLQFPEVAQNINYTNENYPEHPLEYAMDNNNYAMFARILAVRGIQLTGAMLYKALQVNRQMALDLIARGVNVDDDAGAGHFPILALFTTDERGMPLFDDNTTVELLNILHKAAAKSDQVLDVERGDERHKNATPLIMAVQQGKYKTVEALLKGPADIYEKDKDISAAQPDIGAKDEDGKTAINYADALEEPLKGIMKKLLPAAPVEASNRQEESEEEG